MDSYGIDELSSDLSIASIFDISNLEYDVSYLIFCYKNNIINLDITHFKIKAKSYKCSRKLYYDILKIMYNKSETHILLEMMPLIDDYLEYYISI